MGRMKRFPCQHIAPVSQRIIAPFPHFPHYSPVPHPPPIPPIPPNRAVGSRGGLSWPRVDPGRLEFESPQHHRRVRAVRPGAQRPASHGRQRADMRGPDHGCQGGGRARSTGQGAEPAVRGEGGGRQVPSGHRRCGGGGEGGRAVRVCGGGAVSRRDSTGGGGSQGSGGHGAGEEVGWGGG